MPKNQPRNRSATNLPKQDSRQQVCCHNAVQRTLSALEEPSDWATYSYVRIHSFSILERYSYVVLFWYSLVPLFLLSLRCVVLGWCDFQVWRSSVSVFHLLVWLISALSFIWSKELSLGFWVFGPLFYLFLFISLSFRTRRPHILPLLFLVFSILQFYPRAFAKLNSQWVFIWGNWLHYTGL